MGLAASHLPPSPLRGWVLGTPPGERLGRGPTLPGATPQEAGALGHVDAAFSGRHFPVLRRPVLCRQHLAALTRLGCLRHNLPKPKAAGG